MSELKDRIEHINARLFALEGRMTTFEEVSEIQSAARKELLETIIRNQKEHYAQYEKDKHDARERIRGWVAKIAIGLVLLLVPKAIEFGLAIFSLLHKP